jgi:hypothetical protein
MTFGKVGHFWLVEGVECEGEGEWSNHNVNIAPQPRGEVRWGVEYKLWDSTTTVVSVLPWCVQVDLIDIIPIQVIQT